MAEKISANPWLAFFQAGSAEGFPAGAQLVTNGPLTVMTFVAPGDTVRATATADDGLEVTVTRQG